MLKVRIAEVLPQMHYNQLLIMLSFLRGLVMSRGMPGTFFLMYKHKLHITT